MDNNMQNRTSETETSKKTLVFIGIMLLPSLTLFPPMIFRFGLSAWTVPYIYISAIFIIIFVGLYKPCNLFALPFGFMLFYLILLLLLKNENGLIIQIAFVFYILPFAVITFIMAIASSLSNHTERVEQLKQPKQEELGESSEKESDELDNIAKNQEIEALEKSYARKWKIGIITVISIAVVALCTYLFTEVLFETAVISGYNSCLSDYEEYYYKAEGKYSKGWFGEGGNVNVKLYFMPGKKKAMLSKIKEDVNDELQRFVEENSDIFYKYEINDNGDFIAPILYSKIKLSSTDRTRASIAMSGRIILYNQVKNKRNFEYRGKKIIFVEDEIQ